MSASAMTPPRGPPIPPAVPAGSPLPADALEQTSAGAKNYKGFVGGVFSGIAKLSVGHPFDTIKVRLQTTDTSKFKGPADCLMQTLRNEGVKGLYKGATPPLVGWMFMDSIMLGSLSVYRRLVNDHVFNPRRGLAAHEQPQLPILGHAMAGVLAGWTVSFVAGPVEHIKARLQIQYAADKSQRLYSGPIDCLKKITKNYGIRGIYHGLFSTMLFRTYFCFWWGSYEIFTQAFQKHTNLSAPTINFWAGGLSAQIFWIVAYPSDVVKQRIMTDPLGPDRKFPRWRDAAKAVYRESGWRGYFRGFVPCFLRAFPANAMALVAFESVMRALPE